MSLWADYHLERLGRETIETDFGFVCFFVNGEECFIAEAYLSHAARRTKKAKKFLIDDFEEKMIARGVKYLTCTVYIETNNADQSLINIMKDGFKLMSCANNVICLKKEL